MLQPRSDHLGHRSAAKPGEDAAHGRGSAKLPATGEECLGREHPTATIRAAWVVPAAPSGGGVAIGGWGGGGGGG
jgi:hypothetical protein